jgi:hypothetical protein
MKPASGRLVTCVFYLTLASLFAFRPAFADNVVTVGGTVFGYTGAAGISVGWTDFSQEQDVTISALLGNGNGPGTTSTGTAFLTTSIGPGTTIADVVAEASVAVSCGGFCSQDVVLFSGLNLAPGSYWLTFATPVPPATYLNWAAGNPVTATTGSSTIYDGFAYLTGVYDSFPPASPLEFLPEPPPFGYEFSVVTTPEPAYFAVVGLSIACLLVLLRPRSRYAQKIDC